MASSCQTGARWEGCSQSSGSCRRWSSCPCSTLTSTGRWGSQLQGPALCQLRTLLMLDSPCPPALHQICCCMLEAQDMLALLQDTVEPFVYF